MRKLVAAMKMSLDAKIEGPAGVADWVDGWSEDYGLTPRIDACIVGGGMYPGYESYWTAVQGSSGAPLPMTNKAPTAKELEWARFAAQTQHYVLSRTLSSARWANTRFLQSPKDVAELKAKPGKDIYLMGGAKVTAALIEAGLVDELRVIVYPLVAGEGKALFATIARRHALKLRETEMLERGLVRLVYELH